MLHALGRVESLCAITRYCLEALPELASLKLSVLHDSWTANTDEILAAHPDLVIASIPYRMESLAAILKTGLPVLTLAPHSLADMYNDLRLIANQVDARKQAEVLIRDMEQVLSETRAQVGTAELKTVYCEEWGKPMIHSQAWVAELVGAAGGQFLGLPGAQTTPEEIAALDPEILLFAWCGAGNRVPLAKVVAQRGWSHLRAVRSGNVFCIPDQFLNTPAPSLLRGLACIAATTHPEIFPACEDLVRLGETVVPR